MALDCRELVTARDVDDGAIAVDHLGCDDRRPQR